MINYLYLNFYGNIFNTVSNNDFIIGIDMVIIITFPPISTLLAIADSPESLHMLTANSVNIAIPVIFINIFKKPLFMLVLLDISCISVIISDIESVSINIINTPASIDAYIANSGLYCFIIIIIITAIKPYSYYLNNIHILFTFLL